MGGNRSSQAESGTRARVNVLSPPESSAARFESNSRNNLHCGNTDSRAPCHDTKCRIVRSQKGQTFAPSGELQMRGVWERPVCQPKPLSLSPRRGLRSLQLSVLRPTENMRMRNRRDDLTMGSTRRPRLKRSTS